MPLTTFSSVHMHFGGPALLGGVSLDVEAGAKIGLIGQNGTGKSTILRLIAGELEPTDGQVFRQRGLRLAYQTQELHAEPGATALSEMRKVFADDARRQQRLHALEERMARGEDVLAEYERVLHEHESAGGYETDLRIEQVLTGLGLPRAAWNQPITTFSGGERNIIALARIVLQEPELMLLDEPSNHLDMDGIEWFIRFLRRTPAAVVMVSHNRHLLDATVSEIWELKSRKVTRWAGAYSDFARQKEEALALQQRQFKAQQRLIKRIEFQARRLLDMARAYDDPGQAKRAKAMLSRIDQMDKIEAPDRKENRFHASLGDGRFKGHLALEVKDLTVDVGLRVTGYGFRGDSSPDGSHGTQDSDLEPHTPGTVPQIPKPESQNRILLDRASLTIEYGQRVALVGPNGSGKTTLLNAILNHANWEHPEIDAVDGVFHIRGWLRTGKAATIGDYSQVHQHVLDENASLIDWFQRVTDLRFQPASEILHRFLFSRDDLNRPIATLSGGEKSRLQLARLVHERVNFLMLDEPTNHLDIQASEQLEEMLDEFEGTLLIISHDRYFLDKLVNRVVELNDRQLIPFKGTFAKWYEQASARSVMTGPTSGRPAKAGPSSAAQPNQTGTRRKSNDALTLKSQKEGQAKQSREEAKTRQREQHRIRTQLKQLEARIEKLEAKQKELEKRLAKAFTEGGAQEAQEIAQAFEETKANIAGLYQQWEEFAEVAE